MQGLILLAIKQIRKLKANAVVMDCVSASFWVRFNPSVSLLTAVLQVDGDGNFDCLSSMGFTMLHSFEEVNCDAATWTIMHSSWPKCGGWCWSSSPTCFYF
jgi:beta-N-acetylhexosaminidase